MMEIAFTKISSKGQIVLPSEMRKNIEEGEKLLIIKSNRIFIIKKASEVSKKFGKDIMLAKRIFDK